jgi:membrane-associated phospholipid phosphatase
LLHGLRRGGGGAPVPSLRLLQVRTGIGCAVVLGAGMVFVVLSQALDAQASIGQFDAALTRALQLHVSNSALEGFAMLTHLGDTNTRTVLCIAVSALLLGLSQRALAIAWVAAVAGNGAINSLLKGVFERPRPLHDHGLPVADSGWSFPSGHSSGALVTYGMLAYLVLRLAPPRWGLPALLLAAALAFVTGLSRVFLQVHFASDVLAGFASGLMWLTVCVTAVEWARWRSRR